MTNDVLAPELRAWLNAGYFFDFATQQSGEQPIFYRYTPSPDKPVMLIIHGYPTSTWDWHKIWDQLADRYTLVAADMLGHGFSGKPKQTYTVAEQADIVEALLAELNVLDQPIKVVAHDLGDRVLQELLARQYEGSNKFLIERAIFTNGGLFHETYAPRFIQKLLSSPLGAIVGPRTPKRALLKAMDEMFAEGFKPTTNDMEAFYQLVSYNKGLAVNYLVGRFTKETGTYRDRWVTPLEANVVPLRLIDGMQDPNSGAHMVKRYRELVPNADVVELADVSHWPHFEKPKAVLVAINEFMEKDSAC